MRDGQASEQAFTHHYARCEEDLFSSTVLWHVDVTLLLNPLARALARRAEPPSTQTTGRSAAAEKHDIAAINTQLTHTQRSHTQAVSQERHALETPTFEQRDAKLSDVEFKAAGLTGSALSGSEPSDAGRIGNPPAGFDRVIATDGSCLKNPGPGGWAWVEQLTGARDSGGAAHTTNNVMELTALLQALTHVAPHESLLLRIDSQYVINTVTKWAPGWKRKGWKKADGSPVKNRELVEALLDAYQSRTAPTKVVWVKGHDGDAANELCDHLARSQAQRYQRGGTPTLLPRSDTASHGNVTLL